MCRGFFGVVSKVEGAMKRIIVASAYGAITLDLDHIDI